MELWIRSQDKTILCNAHNLIIRENHSESGDINYVIQDLYTIGTYKTKERALEVLDEIQKLFEPKIILKSIKEIAQTLDGVYYTNPDEYEIEQLSSYVYQMPEE